jgi:thiol-disulfide isomerase/thioredoxin
MARLFSAIVLAVAGLAMHPAHAARIVPGDWRLAIATEIGELPFNLRLAHDGRGWSAAFVNGPERQAAEQVSIDGDRLRIAFPSFGSTFEATLADDDTIRGQVTFQRASGPVTVPFTGKANAGYRFFPTPAKTKASVAGRWALTVGAAESARAGIAELKQSGVTVDGATMFFNADSRFLNGELRGDDLYLSTFDGGQGSLWVGRRGADGRLVGKTFSLVTNSVSPWEARLDPAAKLEDPHTLTYLKPGYDRFAFRFPNLSGAPVSLDDPRYRGKVVIVTIAGSWCSTCHDEAAFLEPFYRANRGRGLEVIDLMYEYAADFDTAVAACRNYQKRYGIEHEMLIAGTADKAAASRTLPMINAVLAYPTMIIVDRKGQVRRIHTGFPGPATGVHHETFKREFKALMDELLGEQA